MGAIAGTIPNLIGGVSQQPKDIRPINTAKLLNNVWLSPAIGMVTRPCTEYIGTIDGVTLGADDYVAQHNIQKPSGNYQINMVGGVLKVMNTDTGAGVPIHLHSNALAYLNSGSDHSDLGFTTIADTTFIYNKSVTVSKTTYSESGLTGLSDQGATRRNPNRYSTVWVKQRLSGYHYYSIYINNTERASYYTNTVSPSVIATELQSKLNAGTSVEAATKFGSTHSIISLRLKSESHWVEAVSSGGAGEAMQAINSKVEQFADLTRSDIKGRVIQVAQSDDESADDYWVMFTDGSWLETYGWGSYELLDAGTMPVKLVDNKNGTFTLSRITWDGRTVGDTDSNPTPSFVGQKINNMFIYKGRMCIQSGENFIASRVGDFENYYRSTCTQLLDDDPIDIASPESRGAPLYHAQEFNDKLLMFSEYDQFTIEGDADGLLSPNTVQISHENSYNCSKDVTPVQTGPNVLFADDFGNRSFGAFREYQVERVFGQQVALSLTDSVPEYVPSGVYKMTNSTTDNIMLVATRGERPSLFAYHYYYNNDGKVQAAWNKWKFDGSIYNMDFEGDKLLITMLYDGALVVVGMTFHLNVDEELNDKSVLLDMKISNTDLIANNFAAENTYMQLPYDFSGDMRLVVAPSDTSGLFPLGREIVPSAIIAPDTLVFNNVDLTSVKFYIGNAIKTKWVLNPLYVRDDKQVPIQDGRVQLRSISFLYSNSAYFDVKVTAPLRDPVTKTFTGISVGSPNDPVSLLTLDSGEFRVPAYGEADLVDIEVTSVTPWRVRFTSIEWGGSHRPKRRRV